VVERLARRHEVHVFVLDYYPTPCSYQLLGATVHDLGRTRGLPGVRRRIIGHKLERTLREQGPFDMVHGYWGVPAGVAVTRIARRLHVPAIVTFDSGELVRIDDIEYGLQRRWIDRRAIAFVVRCADAITVPTIFMSRFPALGAARPHVVPVGVDPSRFPRATRRDGPPWRLIRVGSLNRVKDYPTLIEAMAQLVQRQPDVHLDIVGEDTLSGAVQ